MKKTGLLLCCVVLLAGCIGKQTRPSIIPTISFISFGPDTILGGSSKDTAYLTFHVIDGDGDLGNDPGGSSYDIFLKSSRPQDSLYTDFFADIPSGANDPQVGISATTQVLLPAFGLVARDSVATDSISYEVYVHDKAGHESNHIFTNKIYIKAK